MPNYRISVSILEKFRRYLISKNGNTWDTEQALLDSLRGIFTGNDKTAFGQAFHAIIEEPMKQNHYHWQGADYVCVKMERTTDTYLCMPKDAAQKAYDYHQAHPRMFHEVPVGKMYQLHQCGLYVSGRLDGLEGRQIRDPKTKFRYLSNIHEYTDSVQWKLYTDMMEVREFFYDVFEVINYDGWPQAVKVQVQPGMWKNMIFLPGVGIETHEPIHCVTYPGMEDELHTLMVDFMSWIEFRQLHHLLKPCDERGFIQKASTSNKS